jgi:hypothetical protein
MSVLRKIGRFFGKAIRKVGDVVGAVVKPLSVAASVIAPIAKRRFSSADEQPNHGWYW